jgi:hypothetical protein
VNLVRPAGVLPAEPSLNIFESGRASLFACVGVLAALNAQAGQIVNDLTFQNSFVGLANLAGVSGIIWFAMYAILNIGFSGDDDRVSAKDGVILGVAVALAMLPVAAASKIGLELCALYLLLTSTAGHASRRVGIILLGLTGPLVWGRVLLEAFAAPLLSLDAHLVGTVIGTPVHGNIVRFANSPHSFLIGTPCSSLHNISMALVLWTTAAALFLVRFDGRYIRCGLAMAAFMFALNIMRLSLIGLFPQSFTFLHDGAGADLFSWAALLGAGFLVFAGVRDAVARQR